MVTLREAWGEALYGPAGTFVTGRRDFSTALTDPVTGPVLAAALAALAHRVDRALGHPADFTVSDLGAGSGALLAHLAADPSTPDRWSLVGVEHAPRPPHLTARVAWVEELAAATGLLVAHEWLDNVPVEVLCDGWVLDGHGRPTGAPEAADAAWLEQWWPDWRIGEVECGRARDEAWAQAVGTVTRGIAVAVDYGHVRRDRRPTLTGYHDGRYGAARFDGQGDITAHVALDAVGAAVPGSQVRRQRECLTALGVDGSLPSLDVADYPAALVSASAAGRLLSRAHSGTFGWVLTPVGLPAGVLDVLLAPSAAMRGCPGAGGF